ncbi:hypothetical protein Krad_3357 [Kineococcus radiotolerans SRS30216 = ATCC BAA-149]|uniref:Uncharacterized protein n=1 Tax=Kineococcus radiotolerans (strain ATCC BAA-149 / DSM 14245 / SRS30216) TaxID=266940 RepID=A6WDD2_KINRD|nr:hypothetical protein Krad_3357 [Kineococcus radiotolerans SRS30216 = ATCC BAA-149]
MRCDDGAGGTCVSAPEPPQQDVRAPNCEHRTVSGEPTREHLQRVLREAKAGSAGGQADLDDPRRAALVRQMVELKEKAEALGLAHVAAGAQAALEEVAAAEAALRASLAAADEAHDVGLRILAREQEDRG